ADGARCQLRGLRNVVPAGGRVGSGARRARVRAGDVTAAVARHRDGAGSRVSRGDRGGTPLMSGEAVVMLIIAIVLVWGGLATSIVALTRHPELPDHPEAPPPPQH